MRARRLIKEFDVLEVLPVDVNQVVGFIRSEQIKDEINFIGVDIDSEVLRGSINHFVVPGVQQCRKILNIRVDINAAIIHI